MARLEPDWPAVGLPVFFSPSGGGVCDGRPEQGLPEGHPQREPAGGLQLLLLPLCLLLGFALRHDDSHQLVQVSPVHPGRPRPPASSTPTYLFKWSCKLASTYADQKGFGFRFAFSLCGPQRACSSSVTSHGDSVTHLMHKESREWSCDTAAPTVLDVTLELNSFLGIFWPMSFIYLFISREDERPGL